MRRVAGVDEAGRGAWAGPIVAAAVVLPCDPAARRKISRVIYRTGVQINDSKELLPSQRELLVEALFATDAAVSIAIGEVEEIDRRGIGYVNAAVLREAALRLRPAADFVLSDAFRLPNYGSNQRAVIKGDRRSRSIALASCVAKVIRDRIMVELDSKYPGYGFAGHKGYGTAAHRAALMRLGVTPVHRRSFAPVGALCDER